MEIRETMGTIQLSDEELEKKLLQGVSRSFALTIPQLPWGLRRVVTIAYLLCRIADTIEDEENLTLNQKQLFFLEFIDVVHGKASAKHFADELSTLLSNSTPAAEKVLIRNTPYVVQTMFKFRENQQTALKRCVSIMSTGMESFQKIRTLQGLKDLPHLNSYCYYVAGVVGEMLTELLCLYSAKIAKNREKLFGLAASFGQGLQMTNILKDFWDDRGRGACWFPQDVFRKVGCDLNNLSLNKYEPAFGEGLAELIGVARGHLENALAYTLLIPRHETGIRKFCLWAIAMAIMSLRNINNKRNYMRGSDIKISRRTLKAIILATNITVLSNYLLRKLFDLMARSLPAAKMSG
jgi:farnesyl-diphosphate farnesyltransferase